MFKQITIVGFGLIGSSIARGIIRGGLANRIVCADMSREVCEKVQELNLATEVFTDVSKSVKGSDLVILCVPVGAIAGIADKIAPYLEPGCIVTDVGSVKSSVMAALQPRLPSGVHLVGGHPLAGTEFSGPEAGFAELFQNRWCILTPMAHTELRAVEKLTAFWESLGSNIEIMDAGHHDMILGVTSHLPHLIAFTIVGTATGMEEDLKSEVIKFSASGFRDFTRIAASDPVMWRDVFLNNKDAVLNILQRFTEDLTAMQKAIRKGDGDYLYKQFKETRDIRRAIIDAGQAAYAYPKQSAEVPPPVSAPRTKSGSSQ